MDITADLLAQTPVSPTPIAPATPTPAAPATPTPIAPVSPTPVTPTTPVPTGEPLQPGTSPFQVSAWDLLVLIAYFVCIATVIARIINSFNDEYTVRLDGDALKQSLTEQKLQDIVGISFGFAKRYEYGKNDKLNKLSISIANKSKTHSIYVDWDYCTMTDFGNRARRVTRLMPGTTLDLFQSQVFSAIAPGTTLKESIAVEDVLKRKTPKDDKVPVALEMEVEKPLLDFGGLDKKTQVRFKKALQNVEFFLDLAIRLVGPARSSDDHALIRCRFILQKLPWQAGLPWNPK